MSIPLGFCGLDCNACPIRLMTLEPEEAKKKEMKENIAAKLQQAYNRPFSAGNVTDCDGCQADGRLFGGCEACPIRLCAKGKKLESCGKCPEFSCGKTEAHYRYDKESKQRITQQLL